MRGTISHHYQQHPKIARAKFFKSVHGHKYVLVTYLHTYWTTYVCTHGCVFVCVCACVCVWASSLLAPHLNYICARLGVYVSISETDVCLCDKTLKISQACGMVCQQLPATTRLGTSARSQALSHTANPHTHA